MKVLVAHNRYRSALPSGENVVVEADIDVLRSAGVEVVPLIEDSDDIPSLGLRGKLGVASGPVFNPAGVGRMRKMLAAHRPDVVHVHNVFPLLSPWVVRVAHDAGVPVVQTVHNFRQDCVAGTHRRDGHDCFDCAGHTLSGPGIAHGCYRGSRLQSSSMALGLAVHRGTWRNVDLALVPSEFVAVEIRRSDSASQVMIRPHSTPDPGTPVPLGNEVLFVGRLEPDKGVMDLLDAWESCRPIGLRLGVVGEGSLLETVRERSRTDRSIHVHGALTRAQLSLAYQGARLVVQPSKARETFGMTVIESLAHGRPVLVANSGALPELVDPGTGWVWDREESLSACLLTALTEASEKMAGRAYRRYLSKYAPGIGRDLLLKAYETALLPRLVNS